MPQPKKRHSNVRQNKRRFSNYKLSGAKINRCAACGAAVLPHHACSKCGQYDGRQAVQIKQKKDKKGKEQK